MDLVVAKTVYIGTLSAVVGGGFQAFRMTEDWLRHGIRPDAVAYLRELEDSGVKLGGPAHAASSAPHKPHALPWLREAYLASLSPRKAIAVTSLTEALFIARPLTTFAAVMGLVGWLRHGADDALLYNMSADPVATGCAVAATGAAWAHRAPRTVRLGTGIAAAAIYGVGMALLGSRAASTGGAAPVALR
jgi:hypothetical protein